MRGKGISITYHESPWGCGCKGPHNQSRQYEEVGWSALRSAIYTRVLIVLKAEWTPGPVSLTHTQAYIIIRVFCPMAGLSMLTQASRLHFCLKAGLPPQTQEPRLHFSRDVIIMHFYEWLNHYCYILVLEWKRQVVRLHFIVHCKEKFENH